jgi:hypothetical protein
MRPLYDWPVAIKPNSAIVLSPSNTIDGSISRNGFETDLAIPGSRNQMRLEFAPTKNEFGAIVAWLLNNAKGALFRVRAFNTPQLASDATIQANEALYQNGIPFSNNLPFSSGYGFAYRPFVTLAEDVLEGNTSVRLNVANHPAALTYGKLFGLGRSIHHVDDIELDGNIATIQCRTPFRRDYSVARDEVVTLRPAMIGQIINPAGSISLYDSANHIQLGAITLNEVIDERFL